MSDLIAVKTRESLLNDGAEVVVLHLMRSTDCKFCGNTIIGFEKWKNIRFTALKNMNFEQKEIWTYNPSGLPTTSEGFISFPTAACRTSIYTSICTDGKSSRTLVIGWEIIPVSKSQVLLVESEILKEHRIGGGPSSPMLPSHRGKLRLRLGWSDVTDVTRQIQTPYPSASYYKERSPVFGKCTF